MTRQAIHQYLSPWPHALPNKRLPEFRSSQIVFRMWKIHLLGRHPTELLDEHAMPQIDRFHAVGKPTRIALMSPKHPATGKEGPNRPQRPFGQHNNFGPPSGGGARHNVRRGQIVDFIKPAFLQLRNQRQSRIIIGRPCMHRRRVALGQQCAQHPHDAGHPLHKPFSKCLGKLVPYRFCFCFQFSICWISRDSSE